MGGPPHSPQFLQGSTFLQTQTTAGSLRANPALLTDDAVASWHCFVMTLLLIRVCQFSIAQPVVFSAVELLELPVG